MMSGVKLETCSAFKKKLWNNKFHYKVASNWLFLLIQVFVPPGKELTQQQTVKSLTWPPVDLVNFTHSGNRPSQVSTVVQKTGP